MSGITNDLSAVENSYQQSTNSGGALGGETGGRVRGNGPPRIVKPEIQLPPGATAFERKKVRHASGASCTSAAESLGRWIPTPPDGGYGWVIVVASFLNHVIVDGIAYTFGVFYVEFIEYFGEGKAKTSLVGSLLAGFYMFTAPVASALVNKFGCRPVTIGGALIAVLGFVLSTFSTDVDMLIVTYGVIGGSGLGLLYLPNIVAVSYYFEKKRAFATGLAVCGAGVGCFLFAPFAQFLLDTLDWKNAMLIVAGVALHGCAFGCLLKPLRPEGNSGRSRRTRAKNILDRLKEETAKRRGRPRKGSESSEYAPAKQQDLVRRIQLIKWAKESALKEEDWASSEYGSVLDSIQTLNQQPALGGVDSGGDMSVKTPPPGAFVGWESGGVATPHRMQPPTVIGGVHGHVTPVDDGALYGVTSRPLDDVMEKDESIPESDENDEDNDEIQQDLPPSTPEPSANQQNDTTLSRPSSEIKRPMDESEISAPYIDDTEMSQSKDGGKNSDVRTAQYGRQDSLDSYCTQNSVLLNRPPSFIKHVGGGTSGGWGGVSGGGGGALLSVDDYAQPQHHHHRHGLPDGVSREDYARPLYRQDIFYSGSILQLPQYRSQPDVQNYAKSVTAIPCELNSASAGAVESTSCPLWRWVPLWKEARHTLERMTDCSLLYDPLFLVPALSNLLCTIGLYVPFVYVTSRAISMGVADRDSAFLLSIIGITNTAGRLIAGYLADFKWCNSLLLHNVALICAGLACLFNTFAISYPIMCLYAAVFGLCIAAWISLTSIVLCDLLGLERLTNAFGLLCMARGLAAAVGSPIAGLMFEWTQSYDAPFNLSGAMLITGGLICCSLHLPYFQRRKKDRAAGGGEDGGLAAADAYETRSNSMVQLDEAGNVLTVTSMVGMLGTQTQATVDGSDIML